MTVDEFTRAGGLITVAPSSLEERIAAAVFQAVEYNRPTLLRDAARREAVVVSRARYEELLGEEKRLSQGWLAPYGCTECDWSTPMDDALDLIEAALRAHGHAHRRESS